MRKVACLVVPILMAALSCFAQERAPELPSFKQFQVRLAFKIPSVTAVPDLRAVVLEPAFFSLGWGFHDSVISQGRKIGKLDGEYPGQSYTLADVSGRILASAKVEGAGQLRVAQISDGQGNVIGMVRDASLSRDVESFEVRDAQGRAIASTGEVSYYQGDWTLTDAAGRVAGQVCDPGGFSNRKTVDSLSMDPRLVLMVEAAKRYADARHYARAQQHHGGR